MIEQDTIRLLRECDAGVKMGVQSISDVMNRVSAPVLQQRLNESLHAHEKLGQEIERQLTRFKDEGKEPSRMATAMSRMKTNVMLTFDCTDQRIAGLMTDGCNMGVKSLNKYLNEYEAADEFSKDITKRLINLEEKLIVQLRDFL